MNTKTRFRKTKIVLTIVYLLILAAYGVFLFQNFQAKRAGTDMMFGGNALYEVDGGAGAFARPQQSYKAGDKVVCQTEDGYIVCRIEEIVTSNDVEIASIIANGQRNHVALTAVKGVVKAQLPFIGALSSFLRSAYGVVIVVVIPCVIFFIYQVVQLRRTLKDKKKQQIQEEPEPDFAPFSRLPALTPSRGELTDRFSTLTKVAKEPPRDPSGLFKPASPEPARSFSAFDALDEEEDEIIDLFSEMKYKMAFQDTQQLSPLRESPLQELDEGNDLLKYGLKTELIEDGIEVNIDSTVTKEIKLRLKNDGSLSIITDNYQAEINAEF